MILFHKFWIKSPILLEFESNPKLSTTNNCVCYNFLNINYLSRVFTNRISINKSFVKKKFELFGCELELLLRIIILL